MSMIKINEACAILGLPEDDKGKEKARAILGYFEVPTQTPEKVPGTFGAVGKLYEKHAVELIADCKRELDFTA